MVRALRSSLLILLVVAAGSILGSAQSLILDLPLPSQRAQVSQRIGITDITIVYHRPLTHDRKIWGGLVPFSDPVTIEGQPLDKGTYGLHMIPNIDEWTVIFSKTSTAWGSFSYNQAADALRVSVKPIPSEIQMRCSTSSTSCSPTRRS